MRYSTWPRVRGRAQGADASFEQAKSGQAIVAEVVNIVQTAHERTEILSKNMAELGSQAESIGWIMNVISDIADQTNLLALNAAIARRGPEMRAGVLPWSPMKCKLAEKTMQATKEVGTAIDGIQSRTRDSIAGMHQTAMWWPRASEQAVRAGEALSKIVPLVQTTLSRITAIATAWKSSPVPASCRTFRWPPSMEFASCSQRIWSGRLRRWSSDNAGRKAEWAA